MAKAEFTALLFQSSVSHDPSEMVSYYLENSRAAYYYYLFIIIIIIFWFKPFFVNSIYLK